MDLRDCVAADHDNLPSLFHADTLHTYNSLSHLIEGTTDERLIHVRFNLQGAETTFLVSAHSNRSQC